MAFFSLLAFFLFLFFQGCSATSSLTFTNNCGYTVWPAAAPVSGAGEFLKTEFVLEAGESRRLEAPAGWSGGLWGRTLCGVDSGGSLACLTGDCGGWAGGAVECPSGRASHPPATPVKFTPSDAGGGGAVTFCEKYSTTERITFWVYVGHDRGFASPSMARGISIAGVSLLAVGLAAILV